MKNISGGSFLFYLFAAFILFYYIPREEKKIKSRTTVIMTDSLGRKITLIDTRGDGIVDFAVGPPPSSKRLPTEAEKQYFKEHKKQKTP